MWTLEELWIAAGRRLFKWKIVGKGMMAKEPIQTVNIEAGQLPQPFDRAVGGFCISWPATSKDPYLSLLDAFAPKTKSEIIDDLLRSLEKKEWE